MNNALPFGQPGAIITTTIPDGTPLHELRALFSGDPHSVVATIYTRAHGNRDNIPYNSITDDTLNWLGRTGTTIGRRNGERHLLRIVPFLRHGWQDNHLRHPETVPHGISNYVVIGAEQLLADGVRELIDAAAAANTAVWLLQSTRETRGTAVIASYAHEVSWSHLWQEWANEAEPPPTQCAGTITPWWRSGQRDPHARVAALIESAVALIDSTCPTHTHHAGCLRQALAQGLQRHNIDEHEARQVTLALRRLAQRDRRHEYDVLARDTFAPARDALTRLLRPCRKDPLNIKIAQIDRNGRSIHLQDRCLLVPRQDRPALRRQRQLTLLAGGSVNTPFLTIFGDPGRAPNH